MRDLLRETAELAADYLESVPGRPVMPEVDHVELRERLGGPVPDGPSDPAEVMRELAAAGGDSAVLTTSGRYFGFVIGGAVPASLAADWLTSTWDQNPGLYVAGPGASIVETLDDEAVMNQLIERLIAAHRMLNREIRRERTRIAPNHVRLTQLKKQRLAIKDRLFRFFPDADVMRVVAKSALRRMRAARI